MVFFELCKSQDSDWPIAAAWRMLHRTPRSRHSSVMRPDPQPPSIALPQDVYDEVLRRSVALTNLRLQHDEQAQQETYIALRAFCEDTARSGRDHPFLWETLADFSRDAREAIALYLRALALAAQLAPGDVDGSTHFALALRYQDVGESDLAYHHAMVADDIARRTDDLSLRRDISSFLRERPAAFEQDNGLV